MNNSCALFPGQGAQSLSMFKKINDCQFKLVEDFFYELEISSFADIEDQSNEWLNRNLTSSLLTVAASILALETSQISFQKMGYAAGYSVGQWSALYAAKVITKAQLVKIVTERAKIMNDATTGKDTSMISVLGLSLETVELEIGKLQSDGAKVYLSNINCQGNYTISLANEDKLRVTSRFEAAGVAKLINIPTAGGWHSPFLESAQSDFFDFLLKQKFSKPQLSVIDNVTGDFLPKDEEALKLVLSKHLYSPIQWQKGINYLITQGVENFYEFGVGSMLTKFGFFINREKRFTSHNI